MRPLTNDLLIEAWERGSASNPLDRAIALLACGLPGRSAADLAALSIPERDLELLKLRRLTFGSHLRGLVLCEACGADLEFEADAESLTNRMESLRPRSAVTWLTGGYTFTLRPCDSEDLKTAAACADARFARRALFERCVTMRRGVTDAPEVLDWGFEAAIEEKFEDLHQGAEIVLNLLCPSCGERQKTELDIAQFFWAEVRAAAMALLQEVHELARSCGWSETSILQMSATRRRAYLEMARS